MRVRHLRAEAELVADRTKKAALLYEAGYLHEIVLHQPAQAAQDYLAAYNVDNRSRLPLHALVRMFERRRSYKNLARLYDAELRSARSSAERATALTDHAMLSAVSGGGASAVQARLEQALEHEPRTEPALLLEWNRRAAGDYDGYVRALEKRAESCDDPAHRGALLLELATLREARGEVASALEALREAALAPDGVEELYSVELARFAREHGFPQELAEAHERRAARLAFDLTRGELRDDPLAAPALRGRAVAHWYEAARLRCTTLSDPLGALRSLEGALALAPEHLLLKQLRMLAYDMLEDRERAAEEARSLLALGVEGELAAALHFRLAEHALVAGDAESAREKLREAAALAGGSSAALALLDDLLLDDGQHEERIAQREQAAQLAPARAPEALGEAADIAVHMLGDGARARALFAQADALAPGSTQLLYEAYGAALDLRDDELARFALDRLLTLDLLPDERAALVHHRYELGDAADRLALVDAELARGEAGGAAPEIPRAALTQAAQARDYGRLALLHEALASVSDDSDAQVAERCAAARAWVRAGEPARARKLLVGVLEQEPAQRYALTLLEEVMRTLGDAAGAIELLRAAAAQRESARDTELHLLAAGAAAESAGDVAAATASYREAASAGDGRQAGSYGALWALLQLARRSGDSALERSAREALVAREEARGRGGVETLLLAEHLDLVEQQPAAAQARLVRALEDEDVGHHAAIALALSRTAPLEQREQALELLATRATDSLRPALLRQLGGELIAHSARPARVLDLAERVSLVRPDDRWAIWTRTHTRLAHQDDDASALEALAAITTDPQVADAARAEALWARQLAAPEQPLDAALEALPPTPDELGVELGAELASVIVSVASPAHDAALRAQALSRLARDAEPELRPAALLALARAQLAQEDDVAAIETLEELLRLEPSSLAGWELAYVAARRRAHATLLAAAAEQLATLLEGEEALALLEEAADIRIDQLDELPEAERLLTRALALEPTRAHAYARLHECLAQRGDEAGLIALVRKRTTLIDDPEPLLALYYELARRERKRGQIDAAFDAVDHALMLDDDHVGALALLADIHTARGDFAAAVAALERLAEARDLPATQRRLALLGAADFLENRLGDREGALARLSLLMEREPDDPKLALRVADLCERMGKEEGRDEAARTDCFQRAAKALGRALELEPSVGARVALGLRLGDLLRDELAQKESAAEWYARVLDWAPDQLAAARAHFAITADRAQLERTEQALRSRAQVAPRSAEPLRKLSSLAAVTEDRELAHVALAALAALGDMREDERAAWEESQRRARAQRIEPGRTLTDGELARLFTPPLEPRASAFARAVFGAATELDDLTPARFGVGRGQRVSPKAASALRDELRALSGALGWTLDELYVGGSAVNGVAALPRSGQISFVVGAGVASPLVGSARHAAALQLAATHLETLPLLVRGARDGVRLLWAAIASEELPLPQGVRRDELGDLPRTVSKALPRRTRRTLPELIRALPDGGDGLVAHCSAALTYTRRLALALSGELEAALEEVGAESEEALDLLHTWTSAALSASRRKLGLAP